MPFQLSSPAIPARGTIPVRHTGDGEDLSPPLAWSDPPPGTRSFALALEDTDAPGGSFWHWGACNIAAGTRRLDAGAAANGLAMAVNDFGRPGYGGPHPPRGDAPHRYHFRLAALDVDTLPLTPATRVKEMWRAARRHALAETELVAIYGR